MYLPSARSLHFWFKRVISYLGFNNTSTPKNNNEFFSVKYEPLLLKSNIASEYLIKRFINVRLMVP